MDEEVWVIVKPQPTAQGAETGDIPGSGALMGRLPVNDVITNVPLPLNHTNVAVSISAYIASVEVTQEFHNPYDEKIEAVYVFPLPQNAAVNGFVMTIGERKIRGIIREREQAQRIYNEAKRQGYVASLLTQERANIFTQHVANIEPGKRIDVNITYFHTLAYDDGWYEFIYPMVVGPRFNPPGSTHGIGAVARGQAGSSGQQTEIQYLSPNERSGHDISLAVDINAGVTIEEINCVNHKINVSREMSEQMHVELDPNDAIPNKDFVLRYRVAGDQVKTALLTHRDTSGGGGYFTFMLFPPQDISNRPRQPMEMIFVMDCSGSMSGQPIAQSKDAVQHALGCLEPQDTFQIIRFSNNTSQLDPQPLGATVNNIRRGKQYVANLSGGGGTMMIEGIRAALGFPHDPERLRFVTFLTDGYIGNESEILAAVRDRLGSSRIFSFGVGSSPNRYLMNRMAKLGRGAVAYLSLNDDGASVFDNFFHRVSQPVLTDITIDWGNMHVADVIPAHIPDLFVGRPVIITGRFDGDDPTTIRVKGSTVEGIVEASFDVTPVDQANEHHALPAVWARSYIAQLADRATYDADIDLPQQIQEIALRYSLMSAYTSFVAVDSKTRTAGDHGTTVNVAVPVPAGVRYDTTVQDGGRN
ncbi:MAG: VIT domain-containing protein [Phycisphaerales bacterium]